MYTHISTSFYSREIIGARRTFEHKHRENGTWILNTVKLNANYYYVRGKHHTNNINNRWKTKNRRKKCKWKSTSLSHTILITFFILFYHCRCCGIFLVLFFQWRDIIFCVYKERFEKATFKRWVHRLQFVTTASRRYRRRTCAMPDIISWNISVTFLRSTTHVHNSLSLRHPSDHRICCGRRHHAVFFKWPTIELQK